MLKYFTTVSGRWSGLQSSDWSYASRNLYLSTCIQLLTSWSAMMGGWWVSCRRQLMRLWSDKMFGASMFTSSRSYSDLVKIKSSVPPSLCVGVGGTCWHVLGTVEAVDDVLKLDGVGARWSLHVNVEIACDDNLTLVQYQDLKVRCQLLKEEIIWSHRPRSGRWTKP